MIMTAKTSKVLLMVLFILINLFFINSYILIVLAKEPFAVIFFVCVHVWFVLNWSTIKK